MVAAMHLLLPLSGSALLSTFLCFCLVRWSAGLRLVAQPRPDRWHKVPTPNTAGLGILMSCASCILLFPTNSYTAIAACAGAISILGFVDDRVQLRPLVKLAGQSVAALVVMASGVILHLTPWMWVNGIITALWLVGITNAFNLIDNMDGLCGGVATTVALSEAWLALLQHDPQRALLLVIVAGACIGFLVFNHKPARIFLGDCGSMLLGFSLASLAISLPETASGRPALEALYPLPAFLYPVFDVALVSVLRRRAGKPISVGGRDHSSHRMVSTGLTEAKAVGVLWAVATLCAVCAPLTYNRPPLFVGIATLLAIGLTVFGVALANLPGFAPVSQSVVS